MATDLDNQRDPLTGLVVSRAFFRLTQDAIDRSRLTAQRHALCFLDLVDLRSVNREFGRDAGDALLVEIGRAIQRVVPASATVARIGGDEFAILLMDCSIDDALRVAERVASAIADRRYSSGPKSIGVQASVGLAEITSESPSLDVVQRIAEAAVRGARTRGIPAYYYGMPDPAALRYGELVHALATFFLPRCSDQSTLLELQEMSADSSRWRYAYELESRPARKLVSAEAAGDNLLEQQYWLEMVCARTLYNMSGQAPDESWPAPFDPEWSATIRPAAIEFAVALRISELSELRSILDT